MWMKYQTSLLLAAVFSALFSMFWFVPSLAIVIFLSLLFAILLKPCVDALGRKKTPRAFAAALVLVLFIAIVAGFLLGISRTFVPSLLHFIADLPQLLERLRHLPALDFAAPFAEQIEEFFMNFASFSMAALKSSLQLLVGLFSKLLNLIIIVFLTFYLLKDGQMIKLYLAGLFPNKDTARVVSLFDRILEALRNYIRGQLSVCLLTGLFVFLYFSLRDLPYASVFAVLSAVGEFIPVVGPTVASLFGTLLAAIESPTQGAEALLFYIVLTQVNHNVIYPYLIGKSLHLHPAAIMIGILLGGELLGALGMFLAVPFMVTIKLLLEDIFRAAQSAPIEKP